MIKREKNDIDNDRRTKNDLEKDPNLFGGMREMKELAGNIGFWLMKKRIKF